MRLGSGPSLAPRFLAALGMTDHVYAFKHTRDSVNQLLSTYME